MKNAILVLSSGAYYEGISFGYVPPDSSSLNEKISGLKESHIDTTNGFAGELVFNTAMTGYVEVLSDPSFRGQIISMTYPLIGNYGVSSKWSESGSEIKSESAKDNMGLRKEILASGLVVKELYTGPVPDGRIALSQWMEREKISGISGIDTRELTIRLRDKGNENALIMSTSSQSLNSDLEIAKEFLSYYPSMEGRNLVEEVGLDLTTQLPRIIQNIQVKDDNISKNRTQNLRLGILDCGCKHNIIRLLEQRNCDIVLLNYTCTKAEILSQNLDLLLVSNGPGDPATLNTQILLIQSLIGEILICGICLGTQLLALSLGAKTYKLKFGHHGINHPVKDLRSDRLYITSQNHGFAVDAESLPKDAMPWFINTNDGTLEGFIIPSKHVYSVQFHPEAAPGPRDSAWIIEYFIDLAYDCKFKKGIV